MLHKRSKRSQIDPRRRFGLRHLFNIKEPQSTPDDVNMDFVQPVVEMGFEGYAGIPDPTNNMYKLVNVRSHTDTDPTMSVTVVKSGADVAGSANPLGYGQGNNAYVYSHSLQVIASNPVQLQTSMGDHMLEIAMTLHDGATGLSTFVNCFHIDGTNELGTLRASGYYSPGSIFIPLSPIILMEGHYLQIRCHLSVYDIAAIPALTLLGLRVYYNCQVLKVPVGAAIPDLRGAARLQRYE